MQEDCPKMMAESLPFSGSLGPLSGRELDAWYEDLQDILFSETKNVGLCQTASDKQVSDTSRCLLLCVHGPLLTFVFISVIVVHP